MLAFVAFWGVASVFTLALKCNLVRPWRLADAQCSGEVSLSLFSSVVDESNGSNSRRHAGKSLVHSTFCSKSQFHSQRPYLSGLFTPLE